MSTDPNDVFILGVESSCDDTAAAVLRRSADGSIRVLSNVSWDQAADHKAFGGVVPEIAARSHLERIDLVIAEAMSEAACDYEQLSAIAATAGPGLVGGVMVGFTAAKALSIAHGLPLIPINHLEGHALSPRITEDAPFPYLLLLVSGGHTQLVAVDGLGQYRRLGTTIDDAAGEAFDKTAKLLGLGQPGGPRIESAAVGGRADRFALPRPLLKRPGCDFSFSGMKTAVRLIVEDLVAENGAPLTGQDVADIAASFQAAAAAHLAARTKRAMDEFDRPHGDAGVLAVAGGVAANCTIKSALQSLCAQMGWRMVAPPVKYCTDNGAMIANAGAERFVAGLTPEIDDALALAPKARWPLAPPIAGREHGGGKKGPKA